MVSYRPSRLRWPGSRCRLRFRCDRRHEVLQRLAIDGREVPARLEAFVEQHGIARPIQLPLPLRGAA